MGGIPIPIKGKGDDSTGITMSNVFASEFGSSVFTVRTNDNDNDDDIKMIRNSFLCTQLWFSMHIKYWH
jgi:hypothetical protein